LKKSGTQLLYVSFLAHSGHADAGHRYFPEEVRGRGRTGWIVAELRLEFEVGKRCPKVRCRFPDRIVQEDNAVGNAAVKLSRDEIRLLTVVSSSCSNSIAMSINRISA
jgi:hypothetical protein